MSIIKFFIGLVPLIAIVFIIGTLGLLPKPAAALVTGAGQAIDGAEHLAASGILAADLSGAVTVRDVRLVTPNHSTDTDLVVLVESPAKTAGSTLLPLVAKAVSGRIGTIPGGDTITGLTLAIYAPKATKPTIVLHVTRAILDAFAEGSLDTKQLVAVAKPVTAADFALLIR
jgi:hypothetical protein